MGIVGDTFGSAKTTMASLFIIVGLFVCYSAVSRRVHERTVLLGTKKALGLYDREIMLSELSYSFVASLIGSVLGVILARFVVEPIFVKVAVVNFTFKDIVLYFSLKDTAIIVCLEIGLTLLSTYLACRDILKRTAVKLLAGEEPPKAKAHWFEKTKLWNKMSLLSKTMINNCLNEKRRCFATIVGVAGCTALVVTSITLYGGINQASDKQLNLITTYDTIICIDEDTSGAYENVSAELKNLGIDYSPIAYSFGYLDSPDDRQLVCEFMVPLEDSFYDFVTLNIEENGKVSQKVDSDAFVCSSYTYAYDAKIGDTLTFIEPSGTKYNFKMAGTAEYYTPQTALYVNKDAFKESYGYDAKANAFIIKRGDVDLSTLTNALENVDGFISIKDTYKTAYDEFSVYTSVSFALVGVFLILAVVMALLVLLNIFTMHITEKKKEIIVLLINGFNYKQAKKYIYSDTIILTVIGVIFGIALGAGVGWATLNTLCSQSSYFVLTPNPTAMAAGAVVSAILTALTAKIALKQIDEFKLTDINKA